MVTDHISITNLIAWTSLCIFFEIRYIHHGMDTYDRLKGMYSWRPLNSASDLWPPAVVFTRADPRQRSRWLLSVGTMLGFLMCLRTESDGRRLLLLHPNTHSYGVCRFMPIAECWCSIIIRPKVTVTSNFNEKIVTMPWCSTLGNLTIHTTHEMLLSNHIPTWGYCNFKLGSKCRYYILLLNHEKSDNSQCSMGSL